MTFIENILPENFLLPGSAMKFDLTNAIRGLRGMPRSVILIGFSNINSPELLAGAAAKITSAKQAIALAGRYSVLHQMYEALPSITKLSMDVYFYRLDESIGTAAEVVFTVTITGELGWDVPVKLNANGYIIEATLTAGSDQDAVAATLAAAIEGKATEAAMNAVAVDNEVTVTAAFGGTESNDMIFCMEGAEKSDVPIAFSPTGTTAGTGNQDLATFFEYLAVTRITQAAWPGKMNDTVYGVVSSELEELWGPEIKRETQMLEVVAANSQSAASALLATRNSHQVSTLCVDAMVRSPVWAICAAAAGGIEYQASIDPAVPLTGIELAGLRAPAKNFDKTERNNILKDGGSTITVVGERMYIERMVTNYTVNASNVDDASYRNLEWIKTMSWWRWFVTTEFALKYTKYKMAEVYEPDFDGLKIMTAELAEEIMIGMYKQAIRAGLMQDIDGYRQDLQIQIAGASGRLKYKEKPRLVTQLYQEEITSEPILGSLS